MVDVEAALLTYFEDFADYAGTVTTAEKVEEVTTAGGRLLRIRRIGGGDSDVGDDVPTVSIQSYAGEAYEAPRAAHQLDQQVHDRMRAIADGVEVGWAEGVAFDSPVRTSGPVELPYPDPATTVVESIYRLNVR